MWKKVYYENMETDYSVSDEGLVRNDKTNYILKNSISYLRKNIAYF